MSNRVFVFCAASLLTLLSFSTINFSQPIEWKWARTTGVQQKVVPYTISSDSKGNVYTAGFFMPPTVSFGSDTLTNAGSNSIDAFIVKYNAAGTVLWAKSLGGNDSDGATGIVTDRDDNVYLVGGFSSPTLMVGDTILNNTGNSSMFVIKYTPSGQILWAQSWSTTGRIGIGALDIDPDNNICIGGSFTGSSLTIGQVQLLNSDTVYAHFFMTKLTTTGEVVWANTIEGDYAGITTALCTDLNGGIYITGKLDEVKKNTHALFGKDTLTIKGLGGYCDVFVAKYAPNGIVEWAKLAGGKFCDYANGICADNQGNVYITGAFNPDSIVFGTTVLHNPAWGISESPDAFLTKYDTQGNVLWAKSIAANNYGWDAGNDVMVSNQGDIVVTGYTGSHPFFTGNDSLRNELGKSAFIAAYSPDGNVRWAEEVSTYHADGEVQGMAICQGANNAIHIAGYIRGNPQTTSAKFGDTISIKYTAKDDQFFLATMSNRTTSVTADVFQPLPFSLFPNPAKGSFRVRVVAEGDWILCLYSLLGECVYQCSLRSSETEIMPSLSSGVYLYRLYNRQGSSFSGNFVLE